MPRIGRWAAAPNPADSAAGVGTPRYDSIMCSITAQRIAEIGKAIDDLATKASPTARGEPVEADPSASVGAAKAGPAPTGADPIVARVAELWAQLAELDPEMGKRVAGYQNLSAPTDLRPPGPGVNNSRDPTMLLGRQQVPHDVVSAPRELQVSNDVVPRGARAWPGRRSGGVPSGAVWWAPSAGDDFDLEHGADVGVQAH